MKNRKQVEMIMHVNTLLMGIGFFMLSPLLNPYLLNVKQLSMVAISWITTSRMLSSEVSMVFFGALGDKIGCKKTMIMGCASRVIGFLLYGYADNLVAGLNFTIAGIEPLVLIYMLAGAFVGMGSALFMPACYAYYDLISTEENRTHLFALRAALDNSGNIFGPAVGSFLMAVMDFKAMCILCAIIYSASIVVTVIFLPEFKPDTGTGNKKRVGIIESIRDCSKDRAFVFFLVVTIPVMILANQRDFTMPVKISQIEPNYDKLGVIYTIAALISVALQVPMLKFLKSKFKTYTIFAISSFFLTLGLSIMGFTSFIPGLYIGAIFFTLGSSINQPIKTMAVTDFAGTGKVGSYYGFQGFISLFMTLIITPTAGMLYDFARDKTGILYYLPWIVFGALGVALVIVYLIMGKRLLEIRRGQPVTAEVASLEEEHIMEEEQV